MDRETRKFLSMIAVLLVCVLVFFLTPLRTYFSREHVDAWREWLDSLGLWGPLLLIAVLVVTAVAGIPRMYPTILAGSLFSVPVAATLAITGSTLGAVAAYLFARSMGREYVEKKVGDRFAKLFALLRDHGFLLVTLLRMVPFSNFAVTNYVCGVSSIRFPDYLLATILGMIPSTLMFVLLGKGIGEWDIWLIFAATLIFVVFTVIALAYFKRRIAPSLKEE